MARLQIYQPIFLQQLCDETFKQRCDFLFNTAWVMIVATVVVKIKRELQGQHYCRFVWGKSAMFYFGQNGFSLFSAFVQPRHIKFSLFSLLILDSAMILVNSQQVSSRVLYFKVLSPWIKHLYFSCLRYSGYKDHANVIPFDPPFLPKGWLNAVSPCLPWSCQMI